MNTRLEALANAAAHIVGRIHVCTSDSRSARYVLNVLSRRTKLTPAERKAVYKAAIHAHHGHLDVYRSVMTGNFRETEE